MRSYSTENMELSTINSYDGYVNELRKLYLNNGMNYSVSPKTIVLKKHIDVCSFFFNTSLYISENLKEKLIKENITGIELQEINSIEFFIDN